MKLKVIHLWMPALISYVSSVILGFMEEILGALTLLVLYLSLLVATKWAK